MANAKELLEEVYETDYKLTRTKQIMQSQRNELKYALTEEIVNILKENGFPYITRTIDGYIIELDNKELGLIPVELQVKVKNTDYDIVTAEEMFIQKQEKKNQKKD